MERMRAVKLVAPDTLALRDVPVPEPGPGEVLVKIAGAGLCHSDLHVLRMSANLPSFGRTIGHEGAGTVAGSRLRPPTTPGLGPDGAMAEYLVVKARFLDALADLDPVAAAPLADAGTTPMHAVNSARHRLMPGAVAVVIAVGGLGHIGLQILTATTGARVIVLAQQGRLHVETVTYPLEEFERAFADLEAGRVPGRAVLTP